MEARRQWALKRRKELEDELRELSRQKAQVQQRLDELAGAGLPPAQAPRLGGTAPSKAGRKRPSTSFAPPSKAEPALTPAAKRQRLETERQKRVNSLWSQCATITKALQKNKQDCGYFINPVDPVALKCPDYYSIIKKPMALKDVQQKLGIGPNNTRQYEDVQQFVADVRQIWANCRLYNSEGHAVRVAGEKMSDAWEKKWVQSGLEAKFAEEAQRQRAEDNGEIWNPPRANGLHPADASLPARMAEMGSELEELQSRIPAKQRDPNLAASKEPMSFFEKRKLSIAIGNLSGHKIQQVLDIIRTGIYGKKLEEDGRDDEVEVEMDDLDDLTLKALQKFIDKQAPLPAKPTRPTTPANDGQRGGPAAAKGPGQPGGQSQPQSGPHKAGPRDPAAQPPPPHTAAPVQPGGMSPSSSSSSSDSSDSESENEAVSRRENVGDTSTFNHGGQQEHGHGEVTTLVSGTGNRPDGGGILKNATTRPKAVEVDTEAWASLGDNNAADEAAPADQEQNNDLWQEFKSRDQMANDKLQEEKALKDKQQAEKDKIAADAKRKAEQEVADRKAAAAAKEQEAQAQIEAQRQRELAQLQSQAQGSDDVEMDGREDESLLRPDNHRNALLRMKDDGDDNESSDGSDSDDDNEGTGPGSPAQANDSEEDDQEEEGEL